MMLKAWHSIEKVPYCFFRSSIKFQGYMGKKIDDLIPILSKITRPVAAIKSLRFALLYNHSNIWLECAQQYYPKTCPVRILNFNFDFFFIRF